MVMESYQLVNIEYETYRELESVNTGAHLIDKFVYSDRQSGFKTSLENIAKDIIGENDYSINVVPYKRDIPGNHYGGPFGLKEGFVVQINAPKSAIEGFIEKTAEQGFGTYNHVEKVVVEWGHTISSLQGYWTAQGAKNKIDSHIEEIHDPHKSIQGKKQVTKDFISYTKYDP